MPSAFKTMIYHNPGCGTSRTVLERLQTAGLQPEVIEYLDTGWTREGLQTLLKAAGLTPRQALRETHSPAEALGLLAPGVSDDEIFAAMLVHPVLVNRPIVVTPKGARLCRPADLVTSLLPDS